MCTHVYLVKRLRACDACIMIAPPHTSMNNINCGYYSKAAFIYLHTLYVQLLFEGGYYLGCGFYSSKYGTYLSSHRLVTMITNQPSGHDKDVPKCLYTVPGLLI